MSIDEVNENKIGKFTLQYAAFSRNMAVPSGQRYQSLRNYLKYTVASSSSIRGHISSK